MVYTTRVIIITFSSTLFTCKIQNNCYPMLKVGCKDVHFNLWDLWSFVKLNASNCNFVAASVFWLNMAYLAVREKHQCFYLEWLQSVWKRGKGTIIATWDFWASLYQKTKPVNKFCFTSPFVLALKLTLDKKVGLFFSAFKPMILKFFWTERQHVSKTHQDLRW